MACFVVITLLAAAIAIAGAFLLAMAAGLIHEPTPAQIIASSYAASWKKLAR